MTDPIGMDEQPSGALGLGLSTGRALPSDAEIARMVEKGGDELRQVVAAVMMPAALRALAAALQPKCKTCGRTSGLRAADRVFRMARLTGIGERELQTILAVLGVATLAELRAMVTVTRMAETLPLTEKVRRCEAYLEGVYSTHPELRGTDDPPPSWGGSSAEEVDEP